MNPLFNANRLKLGIFMLNGVGQLVSDLPPRPVTWPATLTAAKLADDAGFEAIVPYARWKGLLRPAGAPFVAHDVFEPFTWSAGLAQATNYSAIFATTHVPMMHPIVVAKMVTTIDHISAGRFALNVVAGWNAPEFAMFGEALKEHTDRYAQAAEWMEILRRLWTEREVDFDGEYYHIAAGESFPQPLQHPFPPIMNAGGSDTGRAFAAKYADLCFVTIGPERDVVREQVSSYREQARRVDGREISIWTTVNVVLGETQASAEATARHLAAHRNAEATAILERTRVENARAMTLASGRQVLSTAMGTSALIGDAAQLNREMHLLADLGIDGVVLVAHDFDEMLGRWAREVLPLMERDGLRVPRP